MRKIAVDCDGVLFDFNHRFIEKCNKMFNVNIPPVSPSYPDEWNYALRYIDAKQNRIVWSEICGQDSYAFWRYLPAYEWTKDYLTAAAARADLVFITSRCGRDCEKASADALSICGVSNPHVIIASKKAPVILNVMCTDFLDDRIENHTELLDADRHRTVTQWILDQPWNRNFNHPAVRRIKNPMEMF